MSQESARSRLLVIVLASVLLVSAAVIGVSSASTPSVSPSHRRSGAARGATFLSLWPACGCAKRTDLDAFSLQSGQRVRTLARVRLTAGQQLAAPAAVPAGPVLLTLSSGPGCMAPRGGGVSFGPCVPLADSCAGHVERVDPGSGMMSPLLTFAPSTLVTDAVPSPRGHLLAMRTGNCQTSFLDLHVVVRDVATGREWAIGADAPRCHEIGQPSWSSNDSRLIFPYGPSILRYGTKPSAAQSCSAPRLGRLVIVRADRSSSSRAWKLIAADARCSFMAAAFDRQGVAAVEACPHGPHGFTIGLSLGYAYVLQLDRHGRVIARVRLQPGWEQGLVSTEFRNGRILISQDQPANAGYAERDWVWEFDGRHLRTIAHYAAHDAAQVLAAPW